MVEEMIQGSCLCGAFRFTVTGVLGEVRLCHCDTCRRANGSAFSANCRVRRDCFSLLSDGAVVTEFQSSPGAWRAFCSTCGSPVYARTESDRGGIRIRLGSLPRGVQARVVGHVWVGSKAGWDWITDDLPCFEEGAG